MVAETAYPYTYENFDSQNNNIGDASGMTHSNYNVSVSGQAEALRDVLLLLQRLMKLNMVMALVHFTGNLAGLLPTVLPGVHVVLDGLLAQPVTMRNFIVTVLPTIPL